MIVNHCVRKKICLAAFILLLCHGLKAQDSLFFDLGPENTVYQFKCKDIRGNEFDFSCLEGKIILIVNTGSKCMYRKQLAELQELYEKYKSDNFEIVAFPSRDFFSREKKNNWKIYNHYKKKYHISFSVMALSHVKGKDVVPIYDFFSNQLKNGRFDATPKWNFHKYLIDQKGFVYKSIDPSISPLDSVIVAWIEKNSTF